jgi:hypothetical protein
MQIANDEPDKVVNNIMDAIPNRINLYNRHGQPMEINFLKNVNLQH